MDSSGTNTEMAIVYKGTHKNGKVYIGVSNRNDLITRVYEHKCHAKRQYNDFHRLILKDGINSFKFKIIENVQDSERFDREKFWISIYKNKNKSLNNSFGGQGPNGIIKSPAMLKITSSIMKKRWENNREWMLKIIRPYRTKQFYIKNSLAGRLAKIANQPFFNVYDKESKKLIGRFQTKKAFAKRISVSESTAGRYLSGRFKKGSELYKFVWE